MLQAVVFLVTACRKEMSFSPLATWRGWLENTLKERVRLGRPDTAKCATAINVLLLHLQSSEGKSTMSRETEPVKSSFRRRRSCTLHGSGTWKWYIWRCLLGRGAVERARRHFRIAGLSWRGRLAPGQAGMLYQILLSSQMGRISLPKVWFLFGRESQSEKKTDLGRGARQAGPQPARAARKPAPLPPLVLVRRAHEGASGPYGQLFHQQSLRRSSRG